MDAVRIVARYVGLPDVSNPNSGLQPREFQRKLPSWLPLRQTRLLAKSLKYLQQFDCCNLYGLEKLGTNWIFIQFKGIGQVCRSFMDSHLILGGAESNLWDLCQYLSLLGFKL